MMILTIQTTGFTVKLRPSRATLVDSLIILSVDLSVCCVVRRSVNTTNVEVNL